LAPAKNLECGIAAIDHGADAVYIGADRFGARVAAGNSVEDIRQLCDYAHRYAAKVYVTVNTIIYDNELEDTRQLIGELYQAGVDALLVQDMGLLNMRLPDITLHASTQTDNRTVEKVQWLRSLGFRRVVLARELSAEEVAEVHRAVPDVELEVFVHGALCVSYSGLCYASQYCFGRSANRGACSQFCRMKFDLLDAEGNIQEQQRHLLSLKDLNLVEHLEELADAGASSFKIEGRLKDVFYVKNVVAAYSQQLDRLVARYPQRYQRASQGHCTYTFTPNLKKTFNRGFTTYFLHGRQPDIYSPDTPKAIGEFVGSVKEMRRDSFNVAGTATFANGDGLCFVNDRRELEGFRVNRCEGNRLFPHQMPANLRAGMSLYRNSDQQFERVLSKPTSVRKIPVTMRLKATADGFALTVDDVTVSLACEHQQAAKPQRENIVRQLSRLGDTVYECSDVLLAEDFTYFVPNSVLAELRREIVRLLDEKAQKSSKEKQAQSMPNAEQAQSTPNDQQAPQSFRKEAPHYAHSYLYNIANHESQAFYGCDHVSAYELKGGEGPLMQCRHCLRYSLGYCVKNSQQRRSKNADVKLKEPLFLRLGDGRKFRLEFDCKNCQMNVYAAH